MDASDLEFWRRAGCSRLEYDAMPPWKQRHVQMLLRDSRGASVVEPVRDAGSTRVPEPTTSHSGDGPAAAGAAAGETAAAATVSSDAVGDESPGPLPGLVWVDQGDGTKTLVVRGDPAEIVAAGEQARRAANPRKHDWQMRSDGNRRSDWCCAKCYKMGPPTVDDKGNSVPMPSKDGCRF